MSGKKIDNIIVGKHEVLKNRIFGMPITKMTRHQRVAFTAMIKIGYDTLKKDPKETVFKYNTKDFLKMIGIKNLGKRSNLFSKCEDEEEKLRGEDKDYSVEKTLRELLTKEITFRYKNNKGETYQVEGTNLVTYFKINKNEITYNLSDWIRQRVCNVQSAYIMKLPILSSFTTSHAVVLFEQLEQRRKWGKWEVNIATLKKLFGFFSNEYKNFSDFNRYVLKSGISEINQKTDYELDYEPVKEGRAIKKIIFRWFIYSSSIKKFKTYIRENFVNTELIEIQVGNRTYQSSIAVAKNGKLYDMKNSNSYFTIDEAKRIWEHLYKNQHLLKIKSTYQENKNVTENDYAKYYGCSFTMAGEYYENIILITPVENKLKVKFKNGAIMILPEEDFLKGVLFGTK